MNNLNTFLNGKKVFGFVMIQVSMVEKPPFRILDQKWQVRVGGIL